MYCLCRENHESFMVGCDVCNEWFHGACIGVTESQAEEVDQYIGISCSIIQNLKKTCHPSKND